MKLKNCGSPKICNMNSTLHLVNFLWQKYVKWVVEMDEMLNRKNIKYTQVLVRYYCCGIFGN